MIRIHNSGLNSYQYIFLVSFVGLWDCAEDADLAQAEDLFPLQDPLICQRPRGPIIQYGGLQGITWPATNQVKRHHLPLPRIDQKLYSKLTPKPMGSVLFIIYFFICSFFIIKSLDTVFTFYTVNFLYILFLYVRFL